MIQSIEELENISEIETPFFLYDTSLLHETLQCLKEEATKHRFKVHYALKANSNPLILSIIRAYGLGADCVSGNEVMHALQNSFESSDVVFAGVGKTDKEIQQALDADIFCFNVESKEEIININQLAEASGKIASIAFRINPNINAHTHHYITTGLEENKFGINEWELMDLLQLTKELKHLKLIGIHFHVGSLINDMEVFKNLCSRVNYFIDWFEDRNIQITEINVGGGLGIDYYHPESNQLADFKTYFGIFSELLTTRVYQQVHFELGRAIVAQCGTLVSKVLYIKNGIKTNFAIIDAGMTELIRPALYQSFHKIDNISNSDKKQLLKYDVVGPICESSDCFGKSVELPLTKRGDYIAIRSVGAYGEVMSSNYNLREKAKSIYK